MATLTQQSWLADVVAGFATGVDERQHRSSNAMDAELQWRRLERDLSLLARLPDNWDMGGATSPSPEVLASVAALLEMLRTDTAHMPPSRVVASPNGSIVLEWQTPFGYSEIEIAEPYHGDCMYTDDAGEMEHGEVAWSPRQMNADDLTTERFHRFSSGSAASTWAT